MLEERFKHSTRDGAQSHPHKLGSAGEAVLCEAALSFRPSPIACLENTVLGQAYRHRPGVVDGSAE